MADDDGQLIEAIPDVRRAPTVNSALRVLGDGIRGTEGARVTPLRPNDSGFLDDALQGLDTAAGKDETQANEDE